MGLVAQAEQGANDAMLRVRMQSSDGKEKDDRLQFRRVADGWRMVISQKALENLGKTIKAPVSKKPSPARPPGG